MSPSLDSGRRTPSAPDATRPSFPHGSRPSRWTPAFARQRRHETAAEPTAETLKTRADILLFERGLCESRARAQQLIRAGQVRIGADHVVRKPSEELPGDADLRVVGGCPYVSRAGIKLQSAVDACEPGLAGRVALDIGASTGGFTDLLLQRGVARVYAVDVGYGQLHYRLRNDPRVIVREKVNARYLTAEHVPEPIDVLTVDVSFISLRKVLPPAGAFLRSGAWIFALVKPQFEAGRREVGKGGIVRDGAVRERVVREVCSFAQEELGWIRAGVIPSPITGSAGNQEFVAAFRTP